MTLYYVIAIGANTLFAAIVGATGYFLIRSIKDGYLGKRGEDIKYLIFDDEGKGKQS
jgi:hypothetical protein